METPANALGEIHTESESDCTGEGALSVSH